MQRILEDLLQQCFSTKRDISELIDYSLSSGAEAQDSLAELLRRITLLLALHSDDSSSGTDALARRFGPLIAFNIVERGSLSEKSLNTSVSNQPLRALLLKRFFMIFKEVLSSLLGK